MSTATESPIFWDCVVGTWAQVEAQAGMDRIMERAVRDGYRGKYAR